jgi:hypothetical protein
MKRTNGSLPLMAGAIVVGALCGSAGATLPEPVIWCWDEPSNFTASGENTSYIPMIHIYTTSSNPAASAVDAVTKIQALGVASDAVCFNFFWYGMGDGRRNGPTHLVNDYPNAPALFLNDCDALTHTETGTDCKTGPDSVSYWWYTPWTENGVTECFNFIDDFIDHYEEARGHVDPVRIHQDSEGYRLVDGGSQEAAKAFLECKVDSRWGTSLTPGNTILGSGGYDMYELWDEHGYTNPTTLPNSIAWWDTSTYPQNSIWYEWYFGLSSQIAEAALEQTLFQPMRIAYPGLKCSNYGSTTTTNGVGDNYIRPPHWPGGFNPANSTDRIMQPHWTASGDLQAPLLHPVWFNHADKFEVEELGYNYTAYDANGPHNWPDKLCWDTTLDDAYHNLWAIFNTQDAQGDIDPSEVTPWIRAVGIGHTFYSKTHPVTQKIYDKKIRIDKDQFRQMLTLLRGHNIQEMQLYCPDPDDHSASDITDAEWDDMDAATRQVWKYEPDVAAKIIGVNANGPITTGEYTDEVAYALKDPASLLSLALNDHVPDPDVQLQTSVLLVQFTDAGYTFGTSSYDLADTTDLRVVVYVELTDVDGDDDIEFFLRFNDYNNVMTDDIPLVLRALESSDLDLGDYRKFEADVDLSTTLSVPTAQVTNFLSNVTVYVGARHKTSASPSDTFTIEIDSVQLIPLD